MISMTGGRSKGGETDFEVSGPDSARRVARTLLMHHGADFLKMGATGAISSPHTRPRQPQLTIEEMRTVTEEGHKCGVKVHAHCYGEEGIRNSLEAGVDAIVHGQSLTDNHIEIMKERKLVLLPTLKTFCGREFLSEKAGINDRLVSTGLWGETEPNFKRALRKGVIISMGTDAGMPGNLFGDNPKDLKYMVEWGMTPSQAIKAGTLNAAYSIGKDDLLGTIETGKYADLLVLKNDPRDNINNIWKRLERVMLNGRFIT
jgi:imidazolonepropionase-like amidohydrolase